MDLRKSGPINADQAGSSDRNPETKATPHPDSLNPVNDLSKLTCGPPPKDNLGGRGFGGGDR